MLQSSFAGADVSMFVDCCQGKPFTISANDSPEIQKKNFLVPSSDSMYFPFPGWNLVPLHWMHRLFLLWKTVSGYDIMQIRPNGVIVVVDIVTILIHVAIVIHIFMEICDCCLSSIHWAFLATILR